MRLTLEEGLRARRVKDVLIVRAENGDGASRDLAVELKASVAGEASHIRILDNFGGRRLGRGCVFLGPGSARGLSSGCRIRDRGQACLHRRQGRVIIIAHFVRHVVGTQAVALVGVIRLDVFGFLL